MKNLIANNLTINFHVPNLKRTPTIPRGLNVVREERKCKRSLKKVIMNHRRLIKNVNY
jgi:hypothetical protein